MAADDETAANLSDKRLTVIPEDILQKCDGIRVLDLSKNKGIHLDRALQRFENVTTLDLNECALLAIPDEIRELKQLEELVLSRNALSSALNPALRQLERLKRLRLEDCKLTSLPDWIRDFQQLEVLWLSSNNFASGLGPAIGQLRLLKDLRMTYCKLTNLPEWIGDLTQLEELGLGGNVFSSGLNPAIAKLRGLKRLYIWKCQLTNVPEWIGNLEQLQEIQLQWNKFSSGLNPAIGQLRRLTKLDLQRCELTSLPDWIGNLEQLQEFQLGGNKFSSGLNPAIGQLRRLTKLDLQSCELTSLPDSIGNLEQLQEIRSGGNKFSSGLNPAIGQLRRLTKLDLQSCELTSLPDSIGNLEQLQEILLGGNKFSSGLNPAIGQLRRLTKLDLQSCELTSLPDSIGNLEQLKLLVLGFRRHFGFDYPGKLLHLEVIIRAREFQHEKEREAHSMTSNNFSEGLNPAIGRLKRLECLVLDDCKLKALPDSIGDLEQLEVLSIQSNCLQEYPRCTLRLKKLLDLDLSNDFDTYGNQLRILPVELADSSIESLMLRGNPITEPPEEIWSQGAQAIKSFMRAVIPGGQLMHADSLNMIGDTGAGKTSLTLSLIANSPQTTEDADRTHVLQQCRLMFEEGFGRCVIINDFGGHDIYHSVMPIFLPTNGLIIVVCNLVDENMKEQLRKWMLTVLAKSKEFRLIIVGTHADLVTSRRAHEYLVTIGDQSSALKKKLESLSSDFFKSAINEVDENITRLEFRAEQQDMQNKLKALRDFRKNLERSFVSVVTLSCSVDDGGLQRLRDVVRNSLRSQHNLPVRWCRFMTNVLNPEADCLYITLQEVERISTKHFTEDDDSNALTTVLHYLVATSQIIWLEYHPFLKDFIFHSPQKIIDTCKKIFHHNNVAPSLLMLPETELKKYSKGILLEALLFRLLSAQTENCSASEVLDRATFEVIVSFLQQCNLISYVKKTKNGREFIVPCKLTETEPHDELQELQKKGNDCLNRVTVTLSFVGSIIPLSLFETSLSSMLNVAGELSHYVVWPMVWKDGAVICLDGVTLIAKRIDAVIILTAFSEPSNPSPWTILHPVLKRLNDNVMASWHGAPPTCAIVCPLCERQKGRSEKIEIDLTALVAEVRPNNHRLTCEPCKKAIPRSLCFPIMEGGSFITQQDDVENFFNNAGLKRRKKSEQDVSLCKVSKLQESDVCESRRATSVELEQQRRWDDMDSAQLHSSFQTNYSTLIESLTNNEVLKAADHLFSKRKILHEEKEKVCLPGNTATESARALVDCIIKKDNKELYCSFLEILKSQLRRDDLVRILATI